MTFYQVEERFRGYALVRCQPKTGRTHQIRIHLTHIGHPIVADKLYSGRDRLTLEALTNTEKPPISARRSIGDGADRPTGACMRRCSRLCIRRRARSSV